MYVSVIRRLQDSLPCLCTLQSRTFSSPMVEQASNYYQSRDVPLYLEEAFEDPTLPRVPPLLTHLQTHGTNPLCPTQHVYQDKTWLMEALQSSSWIKPQIINRPYCLNPFLRIVTATLWDERKMKSLMRLWIQCAHAMINSYQRSSCMKKVDNCGLSWNNGEPYLAVGTYICRWCQVCVQDGLNISGECH